MLDFLVKLWPIFAGAFAGFVAGLIWLVRLESKVHNLKEAHNTHIQNAKEKNETLWTKIDTIQTSILTLVQGLARIEGKLDKHDE